MNLEDWANGVTGGSPLDADRLNFRDRMLVEAIVQAASNPESIFAGAITRDANEAPISAVVKWPGGFDGTYSGTPSVNFPGSISAYTVTRITNTGTVTYTQPAVTRNANGSVTNRPPITVS